ncbi:MAG: hypothetical protein ACW99U_00070 [Candidatus Thorarchaeota archaeon]|jgi:hypothetical protein
MSGEIPSFAKYIFLLGFIVSLIFGAWYFVVPESWSTITGWPDESSTLRMMGSFLLTLAVAALLAYRAESWKEVELYVLMIIIWTILGIVGMLWNYATMTLPIAGWLNTGLLALFLVLYLYVYFQGKGS